MVYRIYARRKGAFTIQSLSVGLQSLIGSGAPLDTESMGLPGRPGAARRLRKDIAMPKVLQPHTAVPAGITGKITKTCFDRENPIPFPDH